MRKHDRSIWGPFGKKSRTNFKLRRPSFCFFASDPGKINDCYATHGPLEHIGRVQVDFKRLQEHPLHPHRVVLGSVFVRGY